MADSTEKRLVWDGDGNRTYETGTDHGVLYRMNEEGTGYEAGVAWNGLTAVSLNSSGAEETALWADNIKYLSIRAAEQFGGNISAYTYPPEWSECDGSKELIPGVFIGQQSRRKFGFSYRSIIGNDTKGNDYSEKIHVIYNSSVSPTQRDYETVNDSPSAINFSWEFSSTAASFTLNGKTYNTAEVTIDLTKATAEQKTAVYNKLWGKDPVGTSGEDDYVAGTAATLPSIQDLMTFLNSTFPAA